MLFSKLLLPTLKEAPQEAEVISHQLMLRAGMIRKVASGIYTWLPLGLKVLKKIENIVREEMDASGARSSSNSKSGWENNTAPKATRIRQPPENSWQGRDCACWLKPSPARIEEARGSAV